MTKGLDMPVALLVAATCVGLPLAILWLAMGGGWITAFAIYYVSGMCTMGALIARATLRRDP